MSAYELAKSIHVGAVALTLLSFLVRGGWMLQGSPRLQARWVRIVPHLVDTVLLASALYLALGVYGYPAPGQGWITAKLLALLLYIVLGTLALKRGRTRAVRASAFVGALGVFTYIVAVAVTKSTLPGA